MKKKYLITMLLFNSIFPNYLDVEFASFSYTTGGSYGSCVKFTKSEYNFSDYNECSCAWAANVSNYPNCNELYYNPQTQIIKYNFSVGGEYIYSNFSNDYTCHIYIEEVQDQLLGDINNDMIINVLDVIEVVNLIQDEIYNYLADLNNDQYINVLDAIILINIILGR